MQTDEEVGKMTQNTPVLIYLVAEVPDPSDVPVKKGEASDSDKKCPSPLLPPGTCIGPLPIKNLPYRMKSTPSTVSATKLNNYSQPRPSYPPPPGGTAVGFRPPVMAQNFTQQPMTMVQTSSQYSFPLEFVTPQNFQQPNRPQPPIRPFQQTMPQAFQHSTPQSFQQPPPTILSTTSSAQLSTTSSAVFPTAPSSILSTTPSCSAIFPSSCPAASPAAMDLLPWT
ncbi:hypothetical protein DSO57_1032435 [Entomophthora muscae]|uniref:Uncharacterized protein n=1 Tax=Entomophthora muscae TaxID=34485 RepID=A0ACC2RF65_9FUNG|nr:hypothetical protein DSO57_1032435 [Entomophthora muscae]